MTTTEQPMPTPNTHPSIQGLVRADLAEREQVGIQRYGTPLQPHNGRDALRDAYEEAMDLTCYLRQAIEERAGVQPRPIPTPEDRMRDARQPGPTFATYLNRHDRDQLDARAATAEAERDDALDDLTETRAKLALVIAARDERLTLAESSRLAKRYDEALEARDVLRVQLDDARRQLGAATDALATIRDAGERIDRALATWDTTPGVSEPDPGEPEHEDPARLRGQLAEAHADCARYATERDEARDERDERLTLAESSRLAKRLDQAEEERDYLRRLLDQTTAALNVALHHANDNTTYAPTTDHYKQRAAELDGCRIALQEATEAVAAPGLGSPQRAQEDDRPSPPRIVPRAEREPLYAAYRAARDFCKLHGENYTDDGIIQAAVKAYEAERRVQAEKPVQS